MTSPQRTIGELAADNRDAILASWLERILAAYPPEAARFMRDTPDPFGNPVGAALREELGTLLDAALGAVDEERLRDALDRIVRIRAVQGLPPSAAVGFVLELKPILVRLVDGSGVAAADERARLDRQVDRVLLVAFDVYSACREQVYEIRVRSIRERSLRHVERLNEWRSRRDGSAVAEAEASPPPGGSDEWAP
jgi:hypothetical protein